MSQQLSEKTEQLNQLSQVCKESEQKVSKLSQKALKYHALKNSFKVLLANYDESQKLIAEKNRLLDEHSNT